MVGLADRNPAIQKNGIQENSIAKFCVGIIINTSIAFANPVAKRVDGQNQMLVRGTIS